MISEFIIFLKNLINYALYILFIKKYFFCLLNKNKIKICFDKLHTCDKMISDFIVIMFTKKLTKYKKNHMFLIIMILIKKEMKCSYLLICKKKNLLNFFLFSVFLSVFHRPLLFSLYSITCCVSCIWQCLNIYVIDSNIS